MFFTSHNLFEQFWGRYKQIIHLGTIKFVIHFYVQDFSLYQLSIFIKKLKYTCIRGATSAFLGRWFYSKIFVYQFLLANFLTWKFFTSNDFYLRWSRQILVFLTKKKDFDWFFVKIYRIWTKIFACGADRRRRREKLGILAISFAKFEKNLSDD